MRHRSETGALFEMQEDKPLCAVPTAWLHAVAPNTKDKSSRAHSQPLHAAVESRLRWCSSRMPAHPRRSGPSVLRRPANRCATTNRVTLASVRGGAHHCHVRSQFVALWHGFGANGRCSEGFNPESVNRASFRSGRMLVFSNMTPNPSFEPTAPGVPVSAAQLKR